MIAVRLLAVLIGLFLTVGTLGSVIRTVIVPRAVSSRLSSLVASAVQGVTVFAARTRSDYLARDGILAQGAPLFLVLRLVVWIGLLVAGFSLLFWGSGSGDYTAAIRLSASSILPLGIARAESGLETAIAFLETASGVIVVALQISYLPTLYSSFNKRETLVTMLDSSSGSPPWGPEILARHALIDNIDHLSELYRNWEQWAADIAESHTSYTTLLYFRSPEPRTSWTLALLACMDAAALELALNPLTAPPSTRPFLRMGIVCLRSLSRVTGFAFSADPKPDDPIQLSFEEFQYGVKRILAVGWEAERSAQEAWPHFRGWRVNYESMAYHLATLVDAPPGPWSGTRQGRLESSLVPVRPPHRAPSPEVEALLKVTRQRRAHRSASGSARPATAPRGVKSAQPGPETSKGEK
ncbi:MAG TPA: hypothetical protein VNH20_01860 [Candidatus Dormibacteraeota bacterium]|nr:hypothetical protein [Candidatus Dormibacteraeota bacterium]